MTLVVAVEHPRGVVLGCDSFAGDDDLRDTTDGPKWVQIDAHTVVAYAGSFALGRVLEHGPRPPVRRARERVDRYVYRLAVAVWAAAHAAGVPRDEGELLLVHGGRVWVDSGGGSTVRSGHGYAAIGSGTAPALAALAVTAGDEDPERRVRAVLAAVARHHQQVCAPWWVVTV